MSAQQINKHPVDQSKLGKFKLDFEINRTVTEERRVTKRRSI